MSSEKGWKRLIFRWTAPKGAAVMALFFAIAVLIEYLMVYLFRSFGLTDIQAFLLPWTSSVLTITVSPLFHLIPLGVILVLISSWAYLTRYIAKVPRRRMPAKKPPTRKREPTRRVRRKHFRSLRNFSRKLHRKFRRFSKALNRLRGISEVLRRRFFARAALKSAATVLFVFIISFLALYLLGFPSFIHDQVIELYRGNPSFQGFVVRTIEIASSIGSTLSPIGWLASAINGALISSAPGFRSAIEGLSVSITKPLSELSLVWKYVICQNIAAWVSAVAALAYGQYASSLYRRYRRR